MSKPNYLSSILDAALFITNRPYAIANAFNDQAWINALHLWDVITDPSSTFIEVMAWISEYIPLFYMDVIYYPCPNLYSVFVEAC